MNNPAALRAIKLLDVNGLSTLAQRFVDDNPDISSILLVAYNGSVFASAHRPTPPSSDAPASSSSSSPSRSAASTSQNAITTRSLRTQAITYATAYTSYLRDLRVGDSTYSLSQSVTSTRDDEHESEPIIYESRSSPSVTIISPVGERILLAVTGEFEKDDDDHLGRDEAEIPTEGQVPNGGENESVENTTHDEMTNVSEVDHPQGLDEQQDSMVVPDGTTRGTYTPPHALVESLQETSNSLVAVLRSHLEGMKWPSDL